MYSCKVWKLHPSKTSKKIRDLTTSCQILCGICSYQKRILGFYRSTYVQGGKKRYMATTQFEAADARRAFPCWDEPEAKASFQISLIAKNPHTAVSNMPIKSKKNLGQGRILYKICKNSCNVYISCLSWSGRIRIHLWKIRQNASASNHYQRVTEKRPAMHLTLVNDCSKNMMNILE